MSTFQILGAVEVSIDGRRLVVGGRRQLVLLAFLVLHANRAVSSDLLSDVVWGPERSGSSNRLGMAISRLRQALEPLNAVAGPVLRTVGGGYLLTVRAGELDADVFATRVGEGRAALDAGEPARAGKLLGEALALWRGPPLAEVAFEDFAQGEIRRLEELHLVAVETRIDADLQLGRHAELIGELEALLAAQPTRERVASQLMLALYRCERQGAALEVYQRTRACLAEELGLEPGLALQSLQARILDQSLPLSDSDHGTVRTVAAPPLPATPTIGRQRELAQVTQLVREADARLVTLVGPGGVGKTRLALTVAHALASSFADGACWVELAGVSRSDDVAPAVLRSLSVTPTPGEGPADALRRYLAARELLLVIDNFEHVLDAAPLLSELHATCRRVTVLVTSREALEVAAEHRMVISPLALPPVTQGTTLTEVEAAPASALFLAAARRRDTAFVLTARNAPTVAHICKRLDGLPLALEIAAGRTELVSIDELAVGVESLIDGAGTGSRDSPARQRTVHATVEWSYRLLDNQTRGVFENFAVFAAGATLDAAREVTEGDAESLRALISKSLLQRQPRRDGSTRLTMLETIRQYAEERLARSGRRDAASRRHCTHYLRLTEKAAGDLFTHRESDALATIDLEIDNILAALQWSLKAAPQDALRLAGQLGDYWEIRGDRHDLAWLNAAIQAAGPHPVAEDLARAQLKRACQLGRVRDGGPASIDAARLALELYRQADDRAGISDALCAVAVCVGVVTGDLDAERAYAEEACDVARRAGDDALLGRALATVAAVGGDERLSLMEEAMQLLDRAGNRRGLARFASNAAFVALIEDRQPQAIRLLDIARDAVQKIDSPLWTMIIDCNRGLAFLWARDITSAGPAFERALRVCVTHGFRVEGQEAVLGVAAILAAQGRPDASAQLLGAGRAAGYPASAADESTLERLDRDYFTPARKRFGPEEWTRAEATGATMPFQEALALAINRVTSLTGELTDAR